MKLQYVLSKITNLLIRLSFYCFAFVVIYYCVKYLVILPNALNDDANPTYCIITASIQLIYWILTIIAEQITNRFSKGIWDTTYFVKKRLIIKIYTLIYIFFTLSLGYVLFSFLFNNNQVEVISFYNADQNNKIDKLIYGVEFGLSTILCCLLMYIYKSLVRQTNDDGDDISENRQSFLPNMNSSSINTNENQVQDQNNNNNQ